jgi:hypothetical protein
MDNAVVLLLTPVHPNNPVYTRFVQILCKVHTGIMHMLLPWKLYRLHKAARVNVQTNKDNWKLAGSIFYGESKINC